MQRSPPPFLFSPSTQFWAAFFVCVAVWCAYQHFVRVLCHLYWNYIVLKVLWFPIGSVNNSMKLHVFVCAHACVCVFGFMHVLNHKSKKMTNFMRLLRNANNQSSVYYFETTAFLSAQLKITLKFYFDQNMLYKSCRKLQFFFSCACTWVE